MPAAYDTQELIRLARRRGWRVEMAGSGHYKLYAPDGVSIVTIAATPGGGRSMENSIAELRRHGFFDEQTRRQAAYPLQNENEMTLPRNLRFDAARFARAIKAERLQMGLTLHQMAELLEVPKSTLADWEGLRGTGGRPRMNTLYEVQRKLGWSDLYGGRQQPTPIVEPLSVESVEEVGETTAPPAEREEVAPEVAPNGHLRETLSRMRTSRVATPVTDRLDAYGQVMEGLTRLMDEMRSLQAAKAQVVELAAMNADLNDEAKRLRSENKRLNERIEQLEKDQIEMAELVELAQTTLDEVGA